METTPADWMKIAVEIVACTVMVVAMIGVFIAQYRTKGGLGIRDVQILTVTLILPIILILSLEGVLSGQTTAALIGAVVGYILSGIGKD